MKSLSCNSCGAPIESSICKYCRSTIDESKMHVFKNKDEWLKIYDDIILNKIQTAQTLSEDEDKIFYNLLKHGLIPDDKLETDLIIYYAKCGKKIISYETFEEYMTSLFEKLMKELNFGRIKNYNFDVLIDKDSDSEIDGCEMFASVFSLNQQRLKELYEGNLYGLVVFNHELWHGFQEITIRCGQFNSDIMLMIKDMIIRKYSPNDDYYDMNYRNISYEIDAQDKAIEAVKRFNNVYNLGISDETFETTRNLYGKDINNTDRVVMVNGEKVTMTVDEIFDEIIKIHPELLTKYPQLNVEYIIDNGEVRRKNIDELNEDLKHSENEVITDYIKGLIAKQSNIRN